MEDIREGIKDLVGTALIETGCGEGGCPKAEMVALEAQETCVNAILNYLHSKGVVIKVEGELPRGKSNIGIETDIDVFYPYNEAQDDMLKAGYCKVEEIG